MAGIGIGIGAGLSLAAISGGGLDVPSLWARFDASDEDSITESLDSVSQWDDLGPNGFHVEQGTGSKQPLTNTSTLNGLNTLDFDTTDVLELKGGAISEAFGSSRDLMVSVAFDPNTDGSSFDEMIQFYFSGGNFRFYTRHVDGGSGPTLTPSGSTAAKVMTVQFTRSEREVWINGSSDTSGSFTPSTRTVTTFRIGDIDGSTLGIDGNIGEFLIYTDTADRVAAESYLTDKWIP